MDWRERADRRRSRKLGCIAILIAVGMSPWLYNGFRQADAFWVFLMGLWAVGMVYAIFCEEIGHAIEAWRFKRALRR